MSMLTIDYYFFLQDPRRVCQMEVTKLMVIDSIHFEFLDNVTSHRRLCSRSIQNRSRDNRINRANILPHLRTRSIPNPSNFNRCRSRLHLHNVSLSNYLTRYPAPRFGKGIPFVGDHVYPNSTSNGDSGAKRRNSRICDFEKVVAEDCVQNYCCTSEMCREFELYRLGT